MLTIDKFDSLNDQKKNLYTVDDSLSLDLRTSRNMVLDVVIIALFLYSEDLMILASF